MIDWTDAPQFGRVGTLMTALETLHKFRKDDVVIVETGTTRGDLGGGVVGDGWATLVFGWYCQKYGGKVYTIDMSEEAINECKRITEPYKDVINYVVSDSETFLKTFSEKVDLLYLDSSDDPNIIQKELLAIYDKLIVTSVVVVDDTHNNYTAGKGSIAGKYLSTNGWSLLKDVEGQIVFIKTNMLPASGDYRVYRSYYKFMQALAESGRLELSIDDYDEKARTWYNILLSYLPKKEELPTIGGLVKVLDVGCHTGYNTKLFEEMYGYAEGIDIDGRLIGASRLNHDKCKIMSCTNLKYDDSTFSLVVAKDVYEHCLSPTRAISEAYRVLVDGGMLLALIPLDGEVEGGIDDVTIHPAFYYNNECHTWKATFRGVINRIFDAGFTEVSHTIVRHSDLFGVTRDYGDSVIIVTARKVEGIKKVPIQWLMGHTYWAAFLTMDCTSNCHYCIQNMSRDELIEAKKEYRRGQLEPQEWISFYNSLQKYKTNLLSLVGGEPTFYDGFYEVVNGITGYYKTVTTNLKTKTMDDIESFIANIEEKDAIRINTSFHPSLISIDEFCNKVHMLRNAGILVDQVAMVDYPLSNFKHYYEEFLNRGINLAPQTFLGKMNGVLLPKSNSDLSPDYQEHGIINYDRYIQGFSYEEKRDILCMTRRFLVSPTGSIHRCHYHLYSNRSPIGHVRDEELPTFSDFSKCSDFGYCNPCDYPHTKFKQLDISLGNELEKIVSDRGLAEFLMSYIQEHRDKLTDLVSVVVDALYCSDDPYWELYNNMEMRDRINEFIEEGGIVDNRNAFLLAQLDTLLFGFLPKGLNVYRLLDEVSLLKYIDALGYVIYMRMIEGESKLKELLTVPKLIENLDISVASMETSLAIAPILENKFVLVAGEKNE